MWCLTLSKAVYKPTVNSIGVNSGSFFNWEYSFLLSIYESSWKINSINTYLIRSYEKTYFLLFISVWLLIHISSVSQLDKAILKPSLLLVILFFFLRSEWHLDMPDISKLLYVFSVFDLHYIQMKWLNYNLSVECTYA